MSAQYHDQSFTFPNLNSVNRVLRQLKKEESSLFNCVCSVSSDAAFIDEISRLHPGLPIAANLRCGLWHVRDPQTTCYFKSTDGHNGNWSFSTTRLNVHLAESAANRRGCIIVDATRRGKSFPDSLTKTIPIWATVLNRAVAQLRSYHDSTRLVRDSAFVISSYPQGAQLAADPLNPLKSIPPYGEPAAKARGRHQVLAVKTASTDQDWDTSLHLPPWVSSNERHQIEAKLEQWVRDLCQVSGDVGRLAAVLDKPLRPIWLSQDSRMWLNAMADHTDLPFTPLYLVSASKSAPHRQSIEVGGDIGTYSYSYVPGAGDDEESWARGLTPALFWQHHQELLQAGPHGIHTAVAKLLEGVEQKKRDGLGRTLSMARLSSRLSNGIIDKHHPPPGGVEVSRTTLPAHGLVWLGSTRMAVGPAAAGDPSFVWQHVDAVLNAATPSLEELKASRNSTVSSELECPSELSTVARDTEAAECAGKAGKSNYLRLPVASSKADKHSLERQLPAALEFVSGHLLQQHRVLIQCDAGDDACVCLAVAMHLACFQACTSDPGVQRFVRPYRRTAHTPGARLLMPGGAAVTKHSIRRVLALISRLYPLARPSRGMLKQVFNFFEPPHNVAAGAAAAAAAAAASGGAARAAGMETDRAAEGETGAEGCTTDVAVTDATDAGCSNEVVALKRPALSI
ncbi:TPA: hypothetical protein ACH3X2_002378 [Trebouxia sp. C0005]